MSPLKEIQDLKKPKSRQLIELEARREELFKYYRDRSHSKTYIVYYNGKHGVEERNFEDQKRSRSYKPVTYLLPKRLVKIQHEGPLKILAFSDYRIHDVDMLLDFVRNLREKPDLILYAGDDLRRFTPPPLEFLTLPISSEKYPSELEAARFFSPKENGYFFTSSPEYGFVLRLPRHLKITPESRILSMLEFVHCLNEALEKGGLRTKRDIVTFLSQKYPSLEVIEQKDSDLAPCNGIKQKIDRLTIVDKLTNTEVLRLVSWNNSLYFPLGHYWDLYKKTESSNLPKEYRKVSEDQKYVYYYFTRGTSYNVFEKLAREARYGLAAVAGNDSDVEKFFIRGEGVYELHSTWLIIGPFLFMGLEGSTCGMGPLGDYTEGDVKFRLEYAQRILNPQDKLVIVSHTPPRGVLDRALRFGDEAIGSLALRDFLEETQKSVPLVVCGHVHRCGGMYERLGKTVVVNVSSHDDPFSRANIAWILLNEMGDVKVEMVALPSPIERIFSVESETRWLDLLQAKVGLSKAESTLFIEAFKKYGEKFFEDLPKLASLKFRYGFSWDNVFRFYARGISLAEQITEPIYQEILRQTPPIHRPHLKRGYAKVKRYLEKDRIYLINPFPISGDERLIIIDTEYSNRGVLYGFLDLSSDELKQFWFDEKDKAIEYLRHKEDYLFIHWGGADKKLLKEELNCDAPTLNMLYYVQTSLVAPISSASLRDVYDALCGHKEDELWERSFYLMDGLYKLMLCNSILADPNNMSAREELAEANKVDILALKEVVEKLRRLPSPTKLPN